MRTTQAICRGLVEVAFVVAAIVFPGCDESVLGPDGRPILAGTAEAGAVALSVDPGEAEVADVFEFTYDVTYAAFSGTVTLSLSGLTEDLELVRDLEPKTARVDGTSALPGSFVVRALRARAEPVDLFLHLTSVDAGGSRTEHPPARIRVHLRGAGRLDLDCRREPRSGTAPLRVVFETTRSGCVGRCTVRWDFGDRTGAEQGDVEHEYQLAGEYSAVATLQDESGATATCTRAVSVSAPSAPGPTPGPTVPGGVSAAFTQRTACCPPMLHVDGSGSTGAIVDYAWDLSWTAANPDSVSPSPTAAFAVEEGTRGAITLTVTGQNGQTASVTRTYP
jgi:hypothetical protein